MTDKQPIITAVASPVYAAADGSQINCTITCKYGVHPFTARADDPEEHGRTLFADLVAGKHGPIAPYAG